MAAVKFRTPHTAPRTMSPTVRELFDTMISQRRHISEVAIDLDMTEVGLKFWKSGRTTPNILRVEELAEILGYRLVLEKVDARP